METWTARAGSVTQRVWRQGKARQGKRQSKASSKDMRADEIRLGWDNGISGMLGSTGKAP